LLTEKAKQRAGNNFAELASVLWQEIRSIQEPTVRSGLLGRIANRMALQTGFSPGDSLSDRMEHLAERMAERQIPMEVEKSGTTPSLTILACPYPDLAELDRGVCAMERMLFSEVLGASVKLTACRLDGANCCTFEPSA
jgi:predicted ArsR family transcriptional regulator